MKTSGLYLAPAHKPPAWPHPDRRLLWSLITCALLTSTNAWTETELIPFSGYRLSGEFKDVNSDSTLDVDDDNTFGFAINSDYEVGNQLEFLYSSQSSVLRSGSAAASNVLFDIDIDYIHVGGLVLMPIDEKTNGFIGAGVGVTHFSPNFAGYSSESELSFSLSGGYKYLISKHLGLRLGFRFYGTPVSKNTAIFCAEGACNIRFNSNLFTQYEANAGIILRF